MNLPKLRKKSAGKYAYAFVRHQGKDLVLGKWKSTDANKAYQRFIVEFKSELSAAAGPKVVITDVAVHFAKFARGYYRKHGKTTSEYVSVQIALRKLRSLYAEVESADFGPKRLKIIREQFLKENFCRTTINRYLLHILPAFRIATSDEMILVNIYQALEEVER